jgi:hypothetical protein
MTQRYKQATMPSLEDQIQTRPSTDAVATQNQLLQDIVSLDVKSLFNRGIHSFIVYYLYFMAGVDDMLFRGNEGDIEASAKMVLLSEGISQLTSAVRRMFPQLIL